MLDITTVVLIILSWQPQWLRKRCKLWKSVFNDMSSIKSRIILLVAAPVYDVTQQLCITLSLGKKPFRNNGTKFSMPAIINVRKSLNLKKLIEVEVCFHMRFLRYTQSKFFEWNCNNEKSKTFVSTIAVFVSCQHVYLKCEHELQLT